MTVPPYVRNDTKLPQTPYDLSRLRAQTCKVSPRYIQTTAKAKSGRTGIYRLTRRRAWWPKMILSYENQEDIPASMTYRDNVQNVRDNFKLWKRLHENVREDQKLGTLRTHVSLTAVHTNLSFTLYMNLCNSLNSPPARLYHPQ